MRFGLRVRIVSTVVGVLVVAFVVIAVGSQRLTTRVLAPDVAMPSITPFAQDAAAWFRAHHAWAGADPYLRRMAPRSLALIIVEGDRLRASSIPELDGASVIRDGGNLRVVPRSTVAGNLRDAALRLRAPPSADVIVDGRVAGTIVMIPTMASLPPAIPDARTAAFQQRFLLLFAVTACAATLIALIVAASIVRPIRQLTVAAQTASSSSLPRVAERSRDEIGDLARAFNALGERLMRSEVARRNVVSDVAHELRTPLTNVRCALEAFQDGVDEPTPHALASVLADVLLLQRLVTDLHELSVGDDARPQLDRILTDIEEEARSAVRAFAERTTVRNVRIDVLSQDRVPWVPCDPVRVRQVFHNLIENALRYGRAGGIVTVAISHDRDAVRVTVSDDGEGFPAAEETAIFERLHRTDTSRSRATGGAGLGLAIVKQLVETHGGIVGASGGEGHGASIWFTLPLSGESTAG